MNIHRVVWMGYFYRRVDSLTINSLITFFTDCSLGGAEHLAYIAVNTLPFKLPGLATDEHIIGNNLIGNNIWSAMSAAQQNKTQVKEQIEFFQLSEHMLKRGLERRSLAYIANTVPFKLPGLTTGEHISLR